MHIIFGDEVAEEIRKKNIVLQLETFAVQGKQQTAYCVIMPESIVMTEMPDIDRYCRLHQALIDAWNRADFNSVLHGIEHLTGKFGGEMDSFYTILQDRIKEVRVAQQ